MLELLFLWLCLSGTLIGLYAVCRRDVLAPEFLFTAGFWLAVGTALLHVEKWGICLSLTTICIMLTGIVCFVLTGLYTKSLDRDQPLPGNGEDSPIEPTLLRTLLVTIFGILTLALYYREVLRLGEYAHPYLRAQGIMAAYKHVAAYGIAAVHPVVNQMSKCVYAFGYIYAYIFIQRHFANSAKGKMSGSLLCLPPVLLFFALALLKGNRIDIIALLFALVGMYSLLWHRKKGWQQAPGAGFGCLLLLLFVCGMAGFYYVKDWVGRVSALDFADYVARYIGGSVQLLDLYVREGGGTTVPFGESLAGLFTGLNKLGILHTDVRKALEFRYTPTGVYLGNVYTAFRRYYHDASWCGLLMFPAILSFLMNMLYIRLKYCRGDSPGEIYGRIVYAGLLYVLPLQAMEDAFYINKVSIGYVLELILLYLCLCWVIGENSRKKGGLYG